MCEAAAEVFFFLCFKNCCALAFYFFCPFAVRWPLPWLGSVAVIIPHKQGNFFSVGEGSFLSPPPFFFLPSALGKGGAESREREGRRLFHLAVRCALDNVCARLLAYVYTPIV